MQYKYQYADSKRFNRTLPTYRHLAIAHGIGLPPAFLLAFKAVRRTDCKIMDREWLTESPDDTFALGVALGRKAAAGDVFALIGGLGTGKTLLTKGIARGLEVPDEITSPSFTLMEIYEGGRLTLYHFDLYRLDGPLDLENLFFDEYWEDGGVSVIEWADRAGNRLPRRHTRVTLTRIDPNSRRITLEHFGH